MNRRQALSTIALGSTAVALFPQCSSPEVLPVFQHFEVERKAYRLLRHLTQIILPKGNLPIETREPTAEYVLNIVDNCYTELDRNRFLEGWKAYQDFLKTAMNRSLRKWKPEQRQQVLETLEADSLEENPLAYFYQNTKSLTKQHFTSSAYYMEAHLEYQFIPGGYEPCVAV
ncbi:MAG: gluconate 2-dehydrogenase subunit 3 family protein [Bacteroidota bacterium]